VRVEPVPWVTFGAANTTFHQLAATGVTAFGTFTGAQTCTLSVSPSNQNVLSTPAGSTLFSVTSGCVWTASSNQTWCTLSPASGSGNATLTANYTANSTCASRTATITITANGATGSPATVTVVQAANTTPILTVSPSSQSVANFAGSTTFSISNTGCRTLSWTSSSNQTWCTLSPASGTGNATLTATCSANAGSTRTATITVTATGATGSPKTVTVIFSTETFAWVPSF
jgi:hypothetical protein